VYAGSAQLVALQMYASQAPTALVIFTGLVVNLRFLMYSASMVQYLQARSWWQKISCAYLMTDQSYAVSMSRFQQQPDLPQKRWFYVGTGVAMWLVWQSGTLLGMLVGAQIPAEWQLDFTIPLAFIALLVPQIRSKKIAIVAAVAGLAAVLTASLPFKLGLVVSVLVGIVTGMILEARER
jgi:4-azaleucine resistance transporter AzlC